MNKKPDEGARHGHTRPSDTRHSRTRRQRGTAWAALAALLFGLLAPLPSHSAPSVPRTVETSGLELITPAAQVAINQGLEYLAANQNEDGSLGGGGNFYRRHVAVTALAGIAFLSAGNAPNRGKYGKQVDLCLRFILENTDSTGLISTAEARHANPMYGHGFATLFLAEVYGLTHRTDVREKLKLAVNLIVNSQNREGGWRYFPVRNDADVSATVCQIMALRAARNAGIFVPKSTVDNCIRYVKRCQNGDGGFSYQLAGGHQVSQWPRSAAGLVALYSAGIYEGNEIDLGIRYLSGHSPRGEGFRHGPFYFYGHYYAVQAMWHAGGNHWRQWFSAIRDELIGLQLADGSWRDMTVNNEYGTAMACIVLQMPNNYLPIFQR
jgi:Prenyltransferase and squalene oxidase repeat